MIQVVEFHPSHLAAMDVQPGQAYALESIDEMDMAVLSGPGAYTVLSDDRPIICGGVLEIVPWRGLAWSFIAANLGPAFIHAHRVAKRVIESAPFPRIEMEVDCEFEEGHRWARLLGFELESPRLRKYGFGGRDVAMYARVS